LQLPSPHVGGHAPQSAGHVEHVSVPLQLPSPHIGPPLLVLAAVVAELVDDALLVALLDDDDAEDVDEALEDDEELELPVPVVLVDVLPVVEALVVPDELVALVPVVPLAAVVLADVPVVEDPLPPPPVRPWSPCAQARPRKTDTPVAASDVAKESARGRPCLISPARSLTVSRAVLEARWTAQKQSRRSPRRRERLDRCPFSGHCGQTSPWTQIASVVPG
jgi:hypothetical protein